MKMQGKYTGKIWFVLLFTICFAMVGCASQQLSSTEIITKNEIEQHSTASEQENDFRNGSWGDTIDEVREKESDTLLQETDTILMYDSAISGLKGIALYNFDADQKLFRGVYRFKQTHGLVADYISDYNALKSGLTSRYGEPSEDKITPIGDTKQDITDAEQALKDGTAGYYAAWHTDKTDVQLAMSKEDNNITTSIVYIDINHQDTIGTNGL